MFYYYFQRASILYTFPHICVHSTGTIYLLFVTFFYLGGSTAHQIDFYSS